VRRVLPGQHGAVGAPFHRVVLRKSEPCPSLAAASAATRASRAQFDTCAVGPALAEERVRFGQLVLLVP